MAGLPHPSDLQAPAGGSGLPPAIDNATLAMLQQLDPSGTGNIVHRVLETYHRSLVKVSGEFAAARAAANLPVLGRIAHTLRSSSASVGALVLAGCCKDVELRIRDGQVTDLEPSLQALQNESERVQAAVAAMLSGKGASQ